MGLLRPFHSTSTSLNATELELLHPLTLTDTEHRVIPGMATRLGYSAWLGSWATRLGYSTELINGLATQLDYYAWLGYSSIDTEMGLIQGVKSASCWHTHKIIGWY